MKLLFVENRYATRVHEVAAQQLQARGHEIHWMVQNPVFAPTWGRVHRLAFPRRTLAAADEADYAWLRRTDRGCLHFGLDGRHHRHYDQLIGALLERLSPDAVFGEATEFHELLTIAHAKRLGLRYLSPNATRYPTDRVAFMAHDTLDPVGGDGDVLSDASAQAMIDSIRRRELVPSYVRAAPVEPRSARLRRALSDRGLVLRGWLRGERYVTPSPLRKLALQRGRRARYLAWEALAADGARRFESLRPGDWVLYAMQMQPEGNIDVWGQPWNDQAVLVARAAAALHPLGASLVVKPNPKSKYELSEALLDVASAAPNVIALPHAAPMAGVFPAAAAVLTVTGTVLMECIFAGKLVGSLGRHAMRRYPGVVPLDEPEQVADLWRRAREGSAQTATDAQARALLRWLHARSYDATIWDPVSQPHLATGHNAARLGEAFAQVLHAPWPPTPPSWD